MSMFACEYICYNQQQEMTTFHEKLPKFPKFSPNKNMESRLTYSSSKSKQTNKNR